MAHHRRGKPKSARAGCLLCKPWKANGRDSRTAKQRARDASDEAQVDETLAADGKPFEDLKYCADGPECPLCNPPP